VLKKLASIVVLLFISFSFWGCSYDIEFDDELAEVEELIWAEYSDYIVLNRVPDIDNEHQTVSWRIDFRREYIWSEKRTDEKDPYELMEEIRTLLNDYLTSNDSYLLASYKSEVYFLRPPEHVYTIGEPSVSVGILRNFSLYAGEHYDIFCSVDYSFYGDWDSVTGKEDIYEITMNDCSIEDIERVVGSLPDVRYVLVYDEGITQELAEHYPDIEFV
jgi:hypothetical protein